MIPIVGRNIKIFFRDKANVFFSLLAVLIIIGLYVFFLGKNLTSGLGDSPGAQYVMATAGSCPVSSRSPESRRPWGHSPS